MQPIPTPHFHLSQNLDVLDSVNRWCNAQIFRIQPTQLYIFYPGYSAKYNEWIPKDSPRILTQWQSGRLIKINNRLDIKHPIPNQWLEARVVQISKQDEKQVKVHFNSFHNKYDMWVNLDDREKVAVIGSYSKASGTGKRRKKEGFVIPKEVLDKLKSLHESFKESLKSKKMMIKTVEGDGNCLFRTISDQLYGTEQHHADIRGIVMDYILEERDFFQNYVLDDIEEYVDRKRELGCWGDDVELQAISQIYNRPIEVYGNDDKPIRTFHEDSNNEDITPIRVAYEGSCHYNSIKQEGYQDDGLIQDQFPTWETFFMKNVKDQQGDRKVYRDQFAARGTIDEALNNALNDGIKEDNSHEVENEMLKITETNSILDEIEKAEIRQAQLNDEKNRIDQQLRRIEQLEMQEIKKQSLREQQNKMKVGGFTIEEEFWIQGIRDQGFSDDEIMFAIQLKGRNADEVLNYLYDNM